MTSAALGTLPERPLPGLSQSDPLLPAAPALCAEHEGDEVGFDGGVGAGCSDVRSAITTPVEDGGWDGNAVSRSITQSDRGGERDGGQS